MKFRAREFEKKLYELKDSRDSIVETSAWTLIFNENHADIASIWLDVFKKVNPFHQIALFYLANHVVQSSRKQSLNFARSFLPALKESLTFVRHDQVKAKLTRVLNVWDERRIFRREDIVEMMRSLGGVAEKFAEDFQPSEVFAKLRRCDQLQCISVDSMRGVDRKELQRLSSVQGVRLALKDKAAVEELAQEVEAMHENLKSVVDNLNKENEARVQLLELMSAAERHYEDERKEAKVVANAYKVFGSKVKTVQKGLEEKLKELVSAEDSFLTPCFAKPSSFKQDESSQYANNAVNVFVKQNVNGPDVVEPAQALPPTASAQYVPPLKPPPTPHSDLLQQLPDSTTDDLLSPESPPPHERAPVVVAPMANPYFESTPQDLDLRRLSFGSIWNGWNVGNFLAFNRNE